MIALFLLAVTVSANVNAPTSWGRGYKLYNVNGSYWDLMGEQGVQNGTISQITVENSSMTNTTNISMKSPNAVNATATINFNGSSVAFNNTLTISNEVYQFTNGTLGNRNVDLSTSQNMSWSCSKFVTEFNVNSSNATASNCTSANVTTLTSRTRGTGSNSYALSTNATGITVSSTFSGGLDYATSYIDATGSSDTNAGDQDVVYRTTGTDGTLREVFRINVNTSQGNGSVFSELTIPTSRPSSPVNGSIVLNLTSNVINIYSSGKWYNMTGSEV